MNELQCDTVCRVPALLTTNLTATKPIMISGDLAITVAYPQGWLLRKQNVSLMTRSSVPPSRLTAATLCHHAQSGQITSLRLAYSTDHPRIYYTSNVLLHE